MGYTYEAHSHQGVLLNANESSRPWDSRILDTFHALLQESALNRYPDDDAIELRKAIGKQTGLKPEEIVVGNGSDALLQLMITTLCRDGKTLVMLNPDFGMYRFYAGCIQSDTCLYDTGWDGSFDLDDFVRFAKDHNAGLVLLSNPNNPTGHLLTRKEIDRLATMLDPIVLAADEAYMNFCDQSALNRIEKHDNLIVTQTLSKAWGAAGIRLGYLSASPQLLEKLALYKIVYSISTLDQLAARAVLAHPEIMEDYLNVIVDESNRIQDELKALSSLEAGEFHANFYALRPKDDPKSIEALEQAFEEAGITVRTYGNKERIRITIGLPEENDQVLAILKAFNDRNANHSELSKSENFEFSKGEEHA